MKQLFFILSFVFTVSTWTVQPSWAQPVCRLVHHESLFSRTQTVELAKHQHVAGVVTASGLPVLLMNQNNVQKLKPLTEKSLGVQVALQPEYKNDHGLLRVGDYIIDMDTPGGRGYGEIYQTGLAWKNIDSYMPRMNEYSNKIIEVSFALTDAEFQVAMTYQKLRRAATYRVPFSFNGAQNNLDQPNMIPAGGEHCFTFCRGSSLPWQISEMKTELEKRTGFTFEELKQIPFVREFLHEGLEAIYKADALNTEALNNRIALKIPVADTLVAIFGRKIPLEDHLISLNWLLSIESALQYQNLLNTLGIGSGVGWEGSNSPRATAILVYDPVVSDAEFRNPNYVRPGFFNTWTHQGMTPL